ncbi:MAG TPA: hypothetical protein VMH90_06700, partial [Thermoplasmata archaeon]|nr:hypothetical protein [Thermoplasmata archaeon]
MADPEPPHRRPLFGDEDDEVPPAIVPAPPPPVEDDEEAEEPEEDLDDEAPRKWDPNSPAATYRRNLLRRRAPWKWTAGFLVVLIVALAAYYVISTPHPAGSSSGGGGGGCPSPCTTPVTDYVTLGAPSVSSVTCGEGGQASVEEIPWIGATAPLTTADVFLELREIVDGDIIGGSGSAPFVTRASLCPGAPPSPAYSWYVVVEDTGGANIMTFCYASGWTPVGPGPSSIPLSNGTELFLVIAPAVAGAGY